MHAQIVRLVLGALLLALSLPAAAQPPGKVYRIGILAGSSQDPREQRGNEALQQGLHELGYMEGKNVILEYRYTERNVTILLKTAQQIGLRVPPAVLYQADKVIK